MKKLKKKSAKKNSVSQSSAKSAVLQDKILAYCGYKLVGKKLVATGSYNPVPYQGL
ncbi:MAG: hypothetical protein NC041_05270 [Bacteroides sp.]|nr:hypothetical protein [Prevotella sp.]MCM1407366.1 hypothetical protein [Treponema brennaborense]MCM1469856.1 hypothetical protein [Bacteroides sp.]